MWHGNDTLPNPNPSADHIVGAVPAEESNPAVLFVTWMLLSSFEMGRGAGCDCCCCRCQSSSAINGDAMQALFGISLLQTVLTSAMADNSPGPTSACVSCFVFALGCFEPDAVPVPWYASGYIQVRATQHSRQ